MGLVDLCKRVHSFTKTTLSYSLLDTASCVHSYLVLESGFAGSSGAHSCTPMTQEISSSIGEGHALHQTAQLQEGHTWSSRGDTCLAIQVTTSTLAITGVRDVAANIYGFFHLGFFTYIHEVYWSLFL